MIASHTSKLLKRWAEALRTSEQFCPGTITLTLSMADVTLMQTEIAKCLSGEGELLSLSRVAGQSRSVVADLPNTLDARDSLLREAASRFYTHLSEAEQARRLHQETQRYFASAWLRERTLNECPERHLKTVREFVWRALKLRPVILSAESIRKKIAFTTSNGK